MALPKVLSRKSWTRTSSGWPWRLPLPAAVLEIPDQFLLLRVHRDRRLAAAQEPPHAGVDVLELGVAVGMLAPFARLAVGLQAVARLVQQRGHGPWPDGWPCRVSSSASRRVLLQVQRSGDCGSPRVDGFDQRLQGRQQSRVGLGQRPPPAAADGGCACRLDRTLRRR